jgi:hypothetical protein
VVLPLSIMCGESHLLVPWCASDRCTMVGSDKDCGSSRRPGTEDRGWSSLGRVLGGQTIVRSNDTVCSLYRAQGDEECGFLRLASKPRSMVSPGLASKLAAMGFPVWASKSGATIWGFGPQNQAGYGLSVVPQN